MADKYARDEARTIIKGEVTASTTVSINNAFEVSTEIVTKLWQQHCTSSLCLCLTMCMRYKFSYYYYYYYFFRPWYFIPRVWDIKQSVWCLERLQWGLGNCESVRQQTALKRWSAVVVCVTALLQAATLLYLADFLSDAADAALPASTALCWMYDAARVWTTVTSQVALRLHSHGTSVKPSGLLLLSRHRKEWWTVTVAIKIMI